MGKSLFLGGNAGGFWIGRRAACVSRPVIPDVAPLAAARVVTVIFVRYDFARRDHCPLQSEFTGGLTPTARHEGTMPYRIGLGHDIHRLIENRPLILGGVTIAHDRGLDGHSDADVLLHAITDALLGAAGLGDIGEWFPNDDPQWQGADSQVFVREAVRAVRERGWTIANLDCTIWAERPKLTPHKPKIKQRLAELLDLEAGRINVKAKSGESVGPVGREEAMVADAIVLLERT